MSRPTENMPGSHEMEPRHSQTNPPTDELIGKRLGQFEILNEIGRGGMATVYRARQTSINRIVAVKVLPRRLLHDPGFMERFEREVDVIAHLEHPHILPIYDYGKAEGLPYIAMRYLAGGSMAQRIQHEPLPLDWLERPLLQIAQALDYAHQQGIVHRDLKPGNIMLDENGNAYLSDFGIARVLGSDLTGSAIVGTPAYMSPEQAHGQPLDARSDIYALGIVLFELITGEEPYQAETPMALLLKHINEPLPPLENFREGVPPVVQTVVERATAKNPGERFASAGEMARAFRDALANRAATNDAEEEGPTLVLGSSAATEVHQAQPQTAAAAAGTAPALSLADAEQTDPATALPVNIYRPFILPTLFIGLGLIVVIALLFFDDSLFRRTTLPPTTAPTPISGNAQLTAFPGAQIVESDLYAIAIPNEWIPPERFLDNSSDGRLHHRWQARDRRAFVALTLLDEDVADVSAFEQAIARYDAQEYAPQDTITFLNEDIAPDGSVLRSYRVEGLSDFPYGQMDVIYLHRPPHLAVLEVFSADSAGNSLVETFQMILDSLLIKTTGQ